MNSYVNYLVSKLRNSDDTYAAAEASQALMDVGDDQVVDLIIDVLQGGSLVGRGAAADILGKKGNGRAVGPLLDAYKRCGSDHVRCSIVRALGRLRDPRALPLLIAASGTNTPAWALRQAAAEALGDLGESSAGVQLLLVLAQDSDFDVRASAASALGRLRYRAARGPLLSCLKPNLQSPLRRAAAEALGNLGDLTVTNELLPLVHDSDVGVAVSAMRAVARLQTPETAVSLVAFLKRTNDEVVREAVANVLGDLKDGRAVPHLIAALRDDPSADVKAVVAEALGKLGDPTAIPTLVHALQDNRGDVRQRASAALRRLGNPARDALIEEVAWDQSAARPLLIRVLDTFEDRTVVDLPILEHGTNVFPIWEKALRSRVGARDARIVPLLLAAGNDPSDRIRSAIGWALGELGGTAAVRPLIDLLHDPDWGVRWAATTALSRIGGQALDALAQTLVQSKTRWARCHAAQALGRLGQGEAAKVLLKALKDESRQVRIAAAEALGELRAVAAVPDLIQALADPDLGVRSRAAAALRLIGGEDAERTTVAWDRERRARLAGASASS